MTIKEHDVIRVAQEDGSVLVDHPTFGVISRKRETLEEPIYLFGMETPTKDVVTMTIKGVTVQENLGDSFYIENEKHVEIMMSSKQFVDACTNMNASGVPCTITETYSKGRIKLIDAPTTTQYLKDVVVTETDNSIARSKTLVDDMKQLVGKSGTIKRSDMEDALKIVRKITCNLRDGLPYNLKCFSEVAEKQIAEAKASIELSITNKKDKIIKRLITENPDILLIDKD